MRLNTSLAVAAAALSLGFAGAMAQTNLATAQTAPVGGPTAKQNAPLKKVHTVNDGAAKPGANSFTENEARKHILNSGYAAPSGLAKGKDGVWRGTAMHNGARVPVAMDFKGNVTQGAPGMAGHGATPPMAATRADHGRGSGVGSAGSFDASSATRRPGAAPPHTGAPHVHHHWRHHHHWSHRHGWRHGRGCATHPGPNGVACSGIDRNHNGVSDKEDHAMHGSPHP